MKPHDVALLVAELRGKGLSAWSIHGVLTPLSALLQYAIEQEWTERNPVHALGSRHKPKIERKNRRILSGDEIAGLLAGTPERYRLAVGTQVYTGVRVGELCGLVWGNIDFDAGVCVSRSSSGVTVSASSRRRRRQCARSC
ncbi:MAG: tyrosine-type recombinase/integrase [Actinobacteria bacterium]|nr:tyrosine-type recombinase/integrase [Actinomycetota bacterium]